MTFFFRGRHFYRFKLLKFISVVKASITVKIYVNFLKGKKMFVLLGWL